jgi:7,8-dihydropterin-6-yl-methyl-4-(beta-D-ribofuranosyl)aminobenzene 5'-phosphate synthase
MKITALVENTANKSDIINKHGLSLYIETKNHKMLFDLGPDDTFIKNAETLGIDISEADTVVISHGHSDHGGALGLFLKQNEKADVYIQEKAFDGCAIAVMGMKFNVGLDEKLKDNPRIKLVSGVTEIDEELTVFSDVTERRFPLKGNERLYAKKDGKYVHDDFIHEQHLMIHDSGKTTVISGCSHQGIVNIKQRADVLAGGNVDYMIAGMHLYDPAGRKYEKQELIESVADELSKGNTRFYTCHCTGEKAVDIMRSRLHERLKYLSAGESIEL